MMVLALNMTTKMISAKISSVLSTLKSQGLRGGLRFVSYRLYEEFHERRLGIRTNGLVSSEELGHESAELLEYSPAPYRALQHCLAQVIIRPGEDALLDYGCGMGRVMILAATKPFRRVLGVEISTAMAEKARENIRLARKHLKCEVYVNLGDARTYRVPDDITVIHLFNPFMGDTLAQVVENIQESLQRRPRNLTIIFGNPVWFEDMFGGQNWLKRRDFRSFYPGIDYAIYDCRFDLKSR